jgi:hypothetical protein
MADRIRDVQDEWERETGMRPTRATAGVIADRRADADRERRCPGSGEYAPEASRYADGTARCGDCGRRVKRTAAINGYSRYDDHVAG